MKQFLALFPRSIRFGCGSFSLLEKEGVPGSRVMIVTGGSSMKKNGYIGAAAKALKKHGKDVFTYDRVKPELPADNVDEAAAFAAKNRVDSFIGMGGGSAIDCAKAVSGIYKGSKKSRDYLDGKAGIKGRKAFFAAIPSTAGTGSEVTKNAVLTYPEKNNKLSIRGDCLVPDAVIADPEITASMPREITAYSGMDALSHAVESYFSVSANEYTRQLSALSCRLIMENLEAAFENGRDLKARENMLLASVTAGLAFSTAGLGAVHGIGHAVGAVSGLGHGLVNAILLPYVIDFNSAAVRPLLKRLENEAGGKIADRIRRMNKKFGIPARLSLARPGLNEKSGLVIESLSYSGSMAYNPVKMDRKKAEKLLMEAL